VSASSIAEETTNKDILYFDENDLRAKDYAKNLEKAGCAVRRACDETGLIELLRSLPVNVVFVDSQGSRVSADSFLLLVRESDERLGLSESMSEHPTDGRRGKDTQLRPPDLLRQSIYSRLAGHEEVNDAERLAQDPMFRLMRAELASLSPSFETEQCLNCRLRERQILVPKGLSAKMGNFGQIRRRSACFNKSFGRQKQELKYRVELLKTKTESSAD